MATSFDTSVDIILENDRIKLRPLIADDYNNLLPIAIRNEKLLQYSPQQVNSEDKLKAYIDKAIRQRLEGSRFPFISFDKKAQEYSGSTSYLNISNDNERLEIGATWIGKDFQGTGLNKEQKRLMIGYAFDTLGMRRVELKTDARNLQSQKAMLKIGATQEGTLRSHTVMEDGFRRDTVYFSILKDEWPSIKKNIFEEIC
jgi:RimJ/RimL family protein N-acetyltransferase